ncbi:peptidase associated/transthyretin-like domain-containing protein [Singulisphaera rosea]
MKRQWNLSSLATSSAIAIAAFAAPGCGDDGLGTRYSVSGKVLYKGEPVKKANISFIPTSPDGRGATGSVQDGYYSLTTLTPGDGALPGSYKVTVDDRQVDSNQVQTDSNALAKKRGVTYNAIPQELQIKAAKKAKGALPGKYQIAETSDLQKDVKAESNTIDINLAD